MNWGGVYLTEASYALSNQRQTDVHTQQHDAASVCKTAGGVFYETCILYYCCFYVWKAGAISAIQTMFLSSHLCSKRLPWWCCWRHSSSSRWAPPTFLKSHPTTQRVACNKIETLQVTMMSSPSIEKKWAFKWVEYNKQWSIRICCECEKPPWNAMSGILFCGIKHGRNLTCEGGGWAGMKTETLAST